MKSVLASGYLTLNDSSAVFRKALRKSLIYSQPAVPYLHTGSELCRASVPLYPTLIQVLSLEKPGAPSQYISTDRTLKE